MAAGRTEAVVAELRAAGCVFAEDEAALLVEQASDDADLLRMTAARVGGAPLETILGWAEFEGVRITTAPGVFVPRRRTGLLVRAAVAHLDGLGVGHAVTDPRVVLDLCCGTGAVGAVIRAARSDVVVYAADLDPAAVACARRNVQSDRVFEGDLFAALPDRLRGGFDVIVANAPYVPSGEIAFMPREAREHEAPMALDGGDDGTRIQARVALAASEWLSPEGLLLIETGARQAPETSRHLAAGGFTPTILHDDDLDATAVAGRLGPEASRPGASA